MKKISVSLPDGIVEILDKNVIGKLGEDYSDSLCIIITNWLGEQGYLSKGGKPKDHELKEEHLPSNTPSYTG